MCASFFFEEESYAQAAMNGFQSRGLLAII